MCESEVAVLIDGISAVWREEAVLVARRLDHAADLVELRTAEAEHEDPVGSPTVTGPPRNAT